MHSRLQVTEVSFAPAPVRLVSTGLLGWVSFVIYGRIQMGDVAVRRTRDGRLCLSFPARDLGWGMRWKYFKPIDDATHRDLERQVLAQLGKVAR